jgi:DUF4097 and DUF4098 domain-containing protein YvlB
VARAHPVFVCHSQEPSAMRHAVSRPTRYTRYLPLVALALGLALVVPSIAQAQTAQGKFDRTLTVSGEADLDVTSGSGDITVRAGAAGSVHVIGLIKARESWFGAGRAAAEKVKALEAKPPVEQTGNSIRIGRIEDPDLRQNVSISYEITAPPQCRLRSHTGSGDQNIGDVSGPVEIGSGSGDLVLADIGGKVDASTGSGDITVGSVRGPFTGKTGSGDIRVKDVAGGISASTGSGSVQAAQSAAGSVRVNASSGDVTLRGVQGALRVDTASGDIVVQGTPAGGWDVSSSSGDVTLELPQTAAFELDARSSSGRIDSKHPVTMTGTIERRSLAGTVRGGGPLVRVHTSSGAIRIQ